MLSNAVDEHVYKIHKQFSSKFNSCDDMQWRPAELKLHIGIIGT